MPSSDFSNENTGSVSVNQVPYEVSGDNQHKSCNSKPGINCIYTNADQLNNKLEEIILYVNENNVDIIAINETLPKNLSIQPIFSIPGFNCFSSYEGRGVCIFVKNTFEVKELTDIESIFKPSKFLKINVNKQNYFIFGTVYRSPNSSDIENEKLYTQIDNVAKKYQNLNDKFVIVGDMNFPEIDWNTETGPKNKDNKASKFLNIVHENFLHQLITNHTHHRALQTPTLIDLLVTNDADFAFNIQHNPPFGKSHHDNISFSLNIDPSVNKQPSVLKLLVNKGDYQGMREHIRNTDWDTIITDESTVNECWNKIDSVVGDAINTFIPSKFFNPNQKRHKYIPNLTLLDKVRLKRRAYKHYKKYPTEENYKKYAKLRNQVKWECRKSIRNKEKHIASIVKTNPKSFFHYVSTKTKTRVGISNLTMKNGDLTETDHQKADVLKDFFTSVFTKEDDTKLPDIENKTDTILSHVNITQESMFKKLNSLNISKSCGPDGLHPKVLKELAPVLDYPLKLLFDKTIRDGELPNAWKMAEVKPIFKKGDKSDPSNYRPVSLTSIVCKIFESYIRDALYNHLVDTGLLSDNQFGFCKGRSCTTQLLVTIHKWMQQLDQKIPVDAIYLDFSKAFDTVPHNRLIHKLSSYGIRGKLLDWIRSFLSDRSQYVTVNGCSSSSAPVTSGVPQGSVLGPVLFIYYINDLPDSTISELINIFVDDKKTHTGIHKIDDNIKLQSCIDDLTEWTKLWLLYFSGAKCKYLHIGAKIIPTMTTLLMKGTLGGN